jgi:hypothetical protein
MWNSRLVILSVIFFTMGTAPGKADAGKADWRYYKNIHSSNGSFIGFSSLPLDGQVYAKTRLDLGDVRIFGGQGQEIAFALHEDRETTTDEEFRPRIYNQAQLPGQYSTVSLDLGKTLLTNKMLLETPNRNFKRRVEIEGSMEGRQWLTIKNNAYIFDFTGDQKIQLTEIRYPESNYRHLRVKIWDMGEGPLKIQGVRFFLSKTHTPRRATRDCTLLSRQEDPELKATIFRYDLRHENLPFDILSLQTPEENYSRLVEIQGSNDQKEWRRLAQSELYRFRAARYEVEKESLRFPEARCRFVKLLIYNYDDAPLRVTQVDFQGVEKELIFKAEAGNSYTLYYGNPETNFPRYDLIKTANYLNPEQLPALKVSGETLNPGYVPRHRQIPWTEAHPVFFWSGLVLLALGLGGAIVRLMMKT